MKYLVLIGDGMSDEPVRSLGGKTPLQVAKTPNMDFLVQNGYKSIRLHMKSDRNKTEIIT